MDTAERWQWHANVYAFRRVILGVAREEHTSPCDTNGIWFDSALVDAAEQRLRNRRGKNSMRWRGDDDIWRGRDVENEWARARGYNDFEHYKTVERIDHAEACFRLVRSLSGPQTMPRAVGGKVDDPHAVAAALGVTAREYNPTPEQMRAGRVALGLEIPDDGPAVGAAGWDGGLECGSGAFSWPLSGGKAAGGG
jgi:hypothetical protein